MTSWLASVTSARMRLVMVAATAVALVLLATGPGLGISNDSVYYVTAAESLARQGDLQTFTGESLTAWPPGLPLFLSWGIGAGMPAEIAALTLNLLSLVVTSAAIFLLAHTVLGAGASLLIAILTVLSGPAVINHAMLWSEPAFTALSVTGLALFARSSRGSPGRPYALLALGGLFVSAATLTRLIGIALVPAAILAAWWALRQDLPWGRVRGLLLVGATAALGPLFVLGRNYALSGSLGGPRGPDVGDLPVVLQSFVTNLGKSLTPLDGWIAARSPSAALALVVGVAVVAGVAFVTGALFGWRRGSYPVPVIAAYVVVYVLLLVYSSATSATSPPDMRLLGPAVGPILVVSTYGMRELLSLFEHTPRRARRTLVLGAGAMLFAAASVDGTLSALDMRNQGVGYRQSVATSSPLTAAVRRLPSQTTLVSNNAPQIAWALPGVTVHQVPRTGYEYPALGYMTPGAFLDVLNSAVKPVYFAMYSGNPRQADSVEELRGYGIYLTLIEATGDGELWALKSEESP